MKNIYLAIIETDNEGKNCAYWEKFGVHTNIADAFGNKVKVAQLCETKAEAMKLTEFWNQCYKGNGTYMF